MTEPENFLERWSKRKLAKDEPQAPAREENPPANETAAPAADVARANASVAASEDKAFDPASLPPVESIGADTDVTAFLRPGVPPELTRAALRRAWSADPAIRDFVGLVENGWDFNDPQAMSGFGPIDPSEVARLAGQIIGGLPAAAEIDAQNAVDRGEPSEATPQINERAEGHAVQDVQDAEQAQHFDVQRSAENDAPHKKSRD